MTRSPSIAARRLRQSFAFRNTAAVLWALSSERAPWRPDAITFRMRDGAEMAIPNHAGARVPIFEVFIEDNYRLDDLTAGLRADLVALDIGGHVGSFSVALARHSPLARVHTYEASPVTADWLRRNVERNGLAERVQVHHTALSREAGTLSFADNGLGSGLNGLTAPEGSQVVEVPCITFAEAVARAGGHVDVVKMDTEGAEFDIILGSDPTDWAGVQRVVMEHHTVPGHDVAELQEFFTAAGLRVVDHVEGVHAGALWLSREQARP